MPQVTLGFFWATCTHTPGKLYPNTGVQDFARSGMGFGGFYKYRVRHQEGLGELRGTWQGVDGKSKVLAARHQEELWNGTG